MKIPRLIFSLSLCGLIASAYAADGYYRYPSVRANSVVFTAEGDIWKAPLSGGQAQRLTTHPGSEVQASISPDGQWLAFAASYEGSQEAYVMPVTGGLPKRISFENSNVAVLGWSAQGQVLISTINSVGPASSRVIAAISPKDGQKTVFPVADASEAALDDSGHTLYFTRMGLALRADNVRSYRGGAIAQLWRFDLSGKNEAVPLFPAEHANYKTPMWWKNRLYFVSDRSGSDNLWSMNPDGSDLRQLTQYKDWDVRNATMGDGKIAYQLGADVHVFDVATQADAQPSFQLVSDFDQERSRQIRSPLEQLTDVDLAGKAERILLTARGKLSIAGTGSQRRVDLAIPDGARARSAVFSADDKWVYAIVDISGENEIWKFRADGSDKGEVLTKGGHFHRYNLIPSPDGKWLAHTDKIGRLWLLDLQSKADSVIDDATKSGVNTFDSVSWSADSKVLAIVRATGNTGRNQIGLYELASRQLSFVTSDRYDSSHPAFSPDGQWLYFLSERNFKVVNGAPWGDRNMGPYFDKRSGIFALALQAGNRFPFKADDELSQAETAPSKAKEDEKKPENKDDKGAAAAKKTEQATILIKGLAERLYQVPLASGNYRDLAVDSKRLYFVERDAADPEKSSVKTLSIGKDNPQPELLVAGIKRFALSQNGKHLFYQTQAPGAGEFILVEAGPKLPQDLSKAKVKVDDWSYRSNPQQEWQQMFLDAWRMHRDYLYDSKMRGIDWNAVKSKYSPLVERVTERNELNDVLGMMVAEVGALHSQVAPGDVRKAAPEGNVATLGAVLNRQSDGYRIQHIYRNDDELPAERGPLSQPDLDIREGDVITAVNNKPVLDARDISDLLLNQADKQVLLHVKRGPAAPRPFIVMPVNAEKNAALRYGDWELGNSERVNTASKGRIGYLHLRAMGPRDIASFARDFYSNFTRDGLIIDVRRNNGGNIDSWIIEKLLRKTWAFWSSPNALPETNMQQTFRGHLVVLTDELTYSDGETFAAGIKELKLAPLVGKRTAGAGVWLSDQNRLLDNGMVRAAENPQFAVADGRWLVEGVGVQPDIEVDNPPHATFKGEDQQLEVALQILEKSLREQPVKPLIPQAIPPRQ
jgi:tricorn protease